MSSEKKYIGENALAHLWQRIKEIIPTNTSELTNDSDYITSSYHDNSKQDTSTLENDVKTFINKAYITELIDDGTEDEY